MPFRPIDRNGNKRKRISPMSIETHKAQWSAQFNQGLQFQIGTTFSLSLSIDITRTHTKQKDDEDVTHYPTRRTPSPTGGPSLETSTVGLHIKRLTGEHFTADGHLTVVCTASLGSSYRRSSTVKAVADEAKGPIVNPLRPSTVSTAVTADKRRSAHQQSTGQSDVH